MMAFIIFIGYDRKRKAERRRRPDDMFCNTCKSTLLRYFLETAVLQKGLSFYKFELCSSWFSINHRNIDNHFTEDYWASSCRHVEEVERKYWDTDIAVEAEMEKIVIQVTSSDEDTDTATEVSDYSDTESADEECLC